MNQIEKINKSIPEIWNFGNIQVDNGYWTTNISERRGQLIGLFISDTNIAHNTFDKFALDYFSLIKEVNNLEIIFSKNKLFDALCLSNERDVYVFYFFTQSKFNISQESKLVREKVKEIAKYIKVKRAYLVNVPVSLKPRTHILTFLEEDKHG